MELNKIYNENCLITLDRMPDNFLDLTITSPPYDKLRDYEGYEFNFKIFKKIAKKLFQKTKYGGVVVWVVNDQTLNGTESCTSFKQALYFKSVGFNLHDTMIFQSKKPPLTHNRYEQSFEYMFILSKGKPNTFNPIKIKTKTHGTKRSMNYNCGTSSEKNSAMRSNEKRIYTINNEKIKSNIWYFNTGANKSTNDKVAFEHPAIFPDKLAYDHILSWSNKNDIIYDPFAGSGTTLKVAKILERKYIGSEISEKYVANIIQKRLNENILF